MKKSADISISVPRIDASEKARGDSKYIADLKFPGMLHIRTLRSTVARAEISKIEYPTLPLGYYIIDHRDIPGLNSVKMLVDDWPFLAVNRVNYIGEPIERMLRHFVISHPLKDMSWYWHQIGNILKFICVNLRKSKFNFMIVDYITRFN